MLGKNAPFPPPSERKGWKCLPSKPFPSFLKRKGEAANVSCLSLPFLFLRRGVEDGS